MNGWYPALRNDGVIASGDSGIWITPLSGEPKQVSGVGGRPVWCGQQLVYNRNDNTTQYGPSTVLPIAYNEYVGCDGGQFAGFLSTGVVHRYLWPHLTPATNVLGCAPRFYGCSFGYLTPYQSTTRTLMIDGAPVKTAIIIDWCADRCGGSYLYTVGEGTYGKRIFDNKGNDVSIRSQLDEMPIANFTGIDGLPWMLSNVPSAGTFVRMIYSAWGYLITGDLYYPDARIIGDRLRVVASDAHGAPRNLWVEFSDANRVDLRKA